MSLVKVALVPGTDLAGPLTLLEESLRDGDPVSEDFAERLREAVEAGDVEILAARTEDRILGVVILAYRLNVSAGTHFASVEDLYVLPDERRRGVGRTLLEAADERCASRDISYIEVQAEDEEAGAFYTALGYEPETGVRVYSRSLPIGHRRT